MKFFLGVFLLFFSLFIQSSEENVSGTAWLVERFEPKNNQTHKSIYLLDISGKLIYMNLDSGNAGIVWDSSWNDNSKWEWVNSTLIFSINDDYMRISFKLNEAKNKIAGTGLNKRGEILKYEGTKVE